MVETPARQLGTGGPRLHAMMSWQCCLILNQETSMGREEGGGREARRDRHGPDVQRDLRSPVPVPVPFSSAICHMPSAQARAGRRRRGEDVVVEASTTMGCGSVGCVCPRRSGVASVSPRASRREPTAVSFPHGTARLGLLGGRIAGHGPMARYPRHRVDSTQKINKQNKK